MKLAVFCLLSVLCAQGYARSVQVSKDEWSSFEQALMTIESSMAPTGNKDISADNKFNPWACVPAIKDIGSLAWNGWKLVQERSAINKKADEDKAKCDAYSDPEARKKCVELVDEALKKQLEDLNKRMWELMPTVIAAVTALAKCLFI